MRKWIGIFGILLVIIFVVIFICLTGSARTDVFLHKFEVSEDGKIMTINVEVTSSAGYIRKVKQTSHYIEPDLVYLTFYSTYGINSKLGAKDTFQIELDEYMDEIYFYKGESGYVKVLEKNKETGRWQLVKKNEEYSEAEKYYDYFYENNQIVTLLDNENFSDDDMAAFAVLSLKNLDIEHGNKKEEFDEITEKYFGKKIKNFNNSKTYIVQETGLIKPTGWSFDSTVFMSLIDLTENSDGTKTADFYAINVSDGFWEYPPQKTKEEVKEEILNNKFVAYGTRIPIVRIKFEEKKDENNNMYIKYLSLEYIND